ncbi:Ferredoxin [uncultured archaeon]|nr:Ferredoxin [uncultured archaeon]
MFGIIPGFEKAGYHSKLQTIDRFSMMLVDICQYAKPALSFMDAVVCMEGNGPGAGKPKDVGVLIASRNPYALDAVFCDVIGIDFKVLPTVNEAIKRNLLNPGNIEIKGANISDVRVADFKMPATVGIGDGLSGDGALQHIIKPLFNNAFVVKPVILEKACAGCGVCARSCPVNAIVLENEAAVIDYNKCIRCYCCHEMCPHHSIELNKSILYRLAGKVL